MMEGLDVVTVIGLKIEVRGPVRYSPEHTCYYCAGESFPAEIVQKVYGPEERGAENANPKL